MDSFNGIEKKLPWKITTRTIAYSAILVLLMVGEGVLLASRGSAEITVLRVPGQRYQELPNGYISNLYNFQVVNKTTEPMELVVTIDGILGNVRLIGAQHINSSPGKPTEVIAFIDIKASDLHGIKHNFNVVFKTKEGTIVESVRTSFLAPAP
jgi:polyferredoxin